MKIHKRVSMKYGYAQCSWDGLEVEDEADNKIRIKMTDDQWLDLADRLDAKREYILEKRKEKLEDANSDSE